MRSFPFGLSAAILLLTSSCNRVDRPPPASSAKPAPSLMVSNERGISYLVERNDQGQAKVAPDDFQFKSGDRFRLRFRPGFAAYIYVINRGAHENAFHVLFPASAERAHNPLAKDTVAAVPGDSEWMTFDQSPGNEYLYLIASSVALPDLEKGAAIPRDDFEAQLAEIKRKYEPTSSRRFQDRDWTKLLAARDGDMTLVTQLALKHQ